MEKVLVNGREILVDKKKEQIVVDGITVTKDDFARAENPVENKTTKFANLTDARDRMIAKLEEAKEKEVSKSAIKRIDAQIKDINLAYNFKELGKTHIPDNISVTRLLRPTELKKLMSKTDVSLLKGRNKAITPLNAVYESIVDVFGDEFKLPIINRFFVNYIYFLTTNKLSSQMVAISLFLVSKIGLSRLTKVSPDGLITEENRLFAVSMKEDIKKILVKLSKQY